ncbi:hypothetical protein HXX01_04230 [Candidatus Nomurabacteria bacterium]|nr:hypothetical protein [Candidatus Nomurabacteria bacterium]
MNWFKHILNNSKNNEEANNDLKKKLFDKLSVFAKGEISFAFSELKSKEEGLTNEEARSLIFLSGNKSFNCSRKIKIDNSY